MPRRRNGPRKIKEPKFKPAQRICKLASCLKPFTAKREKAFYCSAKCRQADFVERKRIEETTAALLSYQDGLRESLDAPNDRIWTGIGLLEFAKARTQAVYRLTNMLAIAVPQVVLQNWLDTLGRWLSNLQAAHLKIGEVESVYAQMLQFSQHYQPGHCPECGGTADNPELKWKNEFRCAAEWHRSERLRLDEQEKAYKAATGE